MILSWEEVVREYESMNRTSRATKYLKIWGNILASAYRLNPIEADKMWQSLIELNVEIDESNGKFFVAQIFTTITDNLTGEEAADFLLANQYRTELFLKYRLGYHWSYVEFLVAFYIKNGLIDKAFDFLQLCHSISGNGGLLQEDKDINNLLVSVVSRGLNLSTGSHRYRVIKVKKGQFIDFLARCQECFEGSLLGLVAETYLMISKYIDLKPGSHIRDILLVLSQKELTTAFFDLIYFVRNSINDKIILGTLTQYIQNHNFEVLTRRREDADELDVKQRWLLDYFCNHDELEFLHLSKKEKRCFSDFDTEYMVNLLLQKKYGLFVYFVLEYFKSSEERSWDDCGETLIMSIMDVMEHGYRSSDTIVIYSSHPLGTPEERYGVLFPLYKADYSQLQFIINFVKFIYNNISNIDSQFKNHASSFMYLVADEDDVEDCPDFLDDYNLKEIESNFKKSLDAAVSYVLVKKENVNQDVEAVDSSGDYVDKIMTELAHNKSIMCDFYHEATILEKYDYTKLQPTDTIPDLPIVTTYSNLSKSQLSYYLYLRTLVKEKKPISLESVPKGYLILLCSELLTGVGYSNVEDVYNVFIWMQQKTLHKSESHEVIESFISDYKTLHTDKDMDCIIESVRDDVVTCKNLYRNAVANGDDKYLYQVILANSNYEPKRSAFMTKTGFVLEYNKILNQVFIDLKDRLLSKNINLLDFILGEKNGEYTRDYKPNFKSPAICDWDVVKQIHSFVDSITITYYGHKVVKPVRIVDENGVFERNTNMAVPCVDDDFCDYATKYVEMLIREKAGYFKITYPEVPVFNIDKPRYYSFPSGYSGYYYRQDGNYSNYIQTAFGDIYTLFNVTAKQCVDDFFKLNSASLIKIKDMCKTQKKTPVTPEILKETMETISKDTNNVSSVIEKLLEVYQTATQKNQKAIGDFAATLTFNYWLNNATSSSNFDLKEIVFAFKDTKWDFVWKKPMAEHNYFYAQKYLKGIQDIYTRVSGDMSRLLCDSVVVSLGAIKSICEHYGVDINRLLLGEWKTFNWEGYNGVASCYKNIDNVEIYSALSSVATMSTYDYGEDNILFTRYILKTVDRVFCSLCGIDKDINIVEEINELFDVENYSEIVSHIEKAIYYSVLHTLARRSPKQDDVETLEIDIYFEEPQNTEFSFLKLTSNDLSKEAADISFCAYYEVDEAPSVEESNSFNQFVIDYDNDTYQDFFVENMITNSTYVQEANKQVLTRFYNLYDSYYEQFLELAKMSVEFNPDFNIVNTKLFKNGGGFIGKDLYQFAIIKEDSEDFLQLIEHAKRGVFYLPNFQPYVIIIFYYILNEKITNKHYDLQLVAMCKMWNYYFATFSNQDASLILEWIKNYWLIHCPHISEQEFKKLFDRKIVFLNNFSINNIYKKGVLSFYNDVCYYRVLHGKLCTEGYTNLFEKAIRAINVQLEIYFRSYGISLKKLMALASGKNQYLFLRAVVSPELLESIYNENKQFYVSENERYTLSYNAENNRYQMVFDTQGYDSEFLKIFFEFIVKATEIELRKLVGINIPNSFHVNIDSVYDYSNLPTEFVRILEDNKESFYIEKMIAQITKRVCAESGIITKDNLKSEKLDAIHSTAFHPAFVDIDAGGIDRNGDISLQALEEARRVLQKNQEKLVVDEEPSVVEAAEKKTTHFDENEIKVMKILLSSENVSADLYSLQSQNIIADVVISRINEKSMDLYGDVLIDEDTVPPAIIEDYVEICYEVIKNNE